VNKLHSTMMMMMMIFAFY